MSKVNDDRIFKVHVIIKKGRSTVEVTKSVPMTKQEAELVYNATKLTMKIAKGD